MSREEKVTELLKPVVESMGFAWVGVEYHHKNDGHKKHNPLT